jgi:hypothetical protein
VGKGEGEGEAKMASMASMMASMALTRTTYLELADISVVLQNFAIT